MFFRFLRQPSRPKPPRPVAKSGSAAGSGVVATGVMLKVASNVMFVISTNGGCGTINSGIVRVRTSPAKLSVTGEGNLSAPNVTVAPANKASVNTKVAENELAALPRPKKLTS